MKKFYRVSNIETNQGLWYNYDGEFTGLIHNEFSFCKNSTLPMPFDKEICGWLSATDELETLYFWFTKEDIIRLQKHGYYIHEYETDEYKEHQNHWVIKQESGRIVRRIELHAPELRVYAVNCEPFEMNVNIKGWSDEEFIKEAEEQGTVYTLKGFQEEFNNTQDISTTTHYIRFIYV